MSSCASAICVTTVASTSRRRASAAERSASEAAGSRNTRVSSPNPGSAPTKTTFRRLLVEPAAERRGLVLGDRVEALVDGARQVVRRAQVGDEADDEDRDAGQEEEVPDQPAAEAEPDPAAPA